MPRLRPRQLAVAMALLATLGTTARPVAAVEVESTLVAYLDGKEIPLVDVSKYHCDDFAYPVITCSVSPLVANARVTLAALSAADYVTIFDLPSFSGASMTLSQNYATLMTIGWDDRISSFKGRNNATGRFWTDWFMGGNYWWFCCNQQVPTMGIASNTFSSVERL